MVRWPMKRKDSEGKDLGLIEVLLQHFCLERLRKTTKHFCEDRLCPDRDTNTTLPQYRYGATLRFSVPQRQENGIKFLGRHFSIVKWVLMICIIEACSAVSDW
jgi:hypothetical protein